jgi:CheY-like chemotaxis protein
MKPSVTTSLRVLVVDDVPDIRDSLQIVLSLWGHEVATAADGPSALRAAASQRPHAVVLDLGLPRMGGLEVARKLRAMPETANALIIAFTGNAREGREEDARQAGCDHYLLKPVDPDELARLIRERAEKCS